MKKRILSLALVLALTASLLPSAFAAETAVTTAEALQAALSRGGDIVLGSDIGVKSSLNVTASSKLDLNGYQLSIVRGLGFGNGIVIDLGQTLTVTDSRYSDGSAARGKLYVRGYTGIQTTGATLIIDSGVVESTGDGGAGIGGGNQTQLCDGGTVIINGGNVTATGGVSGTFGGAGIGGIDGGNGGTVTINGGAVTATGCNFAAGIGGGGHAGSMRSGSGGTITINGGTVKATGGAKAYAVGSGSGASSDGGNLTMTGGTLELSRNGTNAANPTFKNCIITGAGAGGYSGGYDKNGNRIALDSADAWAYEGIKDAVNHDLLPQSLQSNYAQPTTRAEFCALAVALYESVKNTEITERKTFADTADVNVQKMGALGVVSGIGSDRFDPNGALTREQAATMLARLAAAVGKPLPERGATFSDNAAISSWAMQQVGQMQAAEIMGGIGNNRFDPAGSYTREQSIVTILRLFNAMQ